MIRLTASESGTYRFLGTGAYSNRPSSYSTKEPGSSDIFIQFYTRGSIEWR